MFRLLSILSLLEKEKIPKKIYKKLYTGKIWMPKIKELNKKIYKKSDLFSIKSLREKCLIKIIIELIKIVINFLIKL